MIKRKYILIIAGVFAIAFVLNAYAMMGGGNHSSSSSVYNSQGHHIGLDNHNQGYHMNNINTGSVRSNKRYQGNEQGSMSGGYNNQEFQRKNNMNYEGYHKKDAMDNNNMEFNYYNGENNL